MYAGEQITKLMMHPGVRAASLAYRCFRASQPVALCIREWRDIPPWSEFRIFIKGREILGISQYHWRCTFPHIEHSVETLVDTVHQASLCISATAHLKSVVADVCVTAMDADASWVLIELNPYSIASGGCLFTWDAGGDFDGTFRYRAANGDFRSLPLRIE